MTKRDLVARISEQTGLTKVEVARVVEKAFDYIIETLSLGKGIELRNFGVFEVRQRKSRIGRNPSNPGKEYPIPARAVVKFKPGKEMKESVKRSASVQADGAGPVGTANP